ncbi:MAG: serine/threonine-protein phosphatase [Lachnospiraceae bacterium]|nr:serine/threonine-protein phosphatase [Lachnospiraceae bacterium]
MKIWTADCSSSGGRSCNEDTAGYMEIKGNYLAAVADGLGGHGGGKEASGLVVRSFFEKFREQPEITEENLMRLMEEANGEVRKQQTESKKMKTTFVGFLCNGYCWACVHVGDSRLYWFQNGILKFRTLDHSVSQMAALAGEISDRGIRFHADRNRVLRALGGSELVRPDIFISGGQPENSAFLLCTDGFWENVWEEEMAADLVKSETPEDWLSYMLARIGGRINQNCDNLSAVAVFIHT